VVGALAKKISSYCKCQYTMDYIEVWDVRCQPQNSDVFDVILTGRLIPTNLKRSSDIMKAMSDWVNSAQPVITIDDERMNVDKNCNVQIEHPYGTDCVQAAAVAAAPSTGAVTNNNDNDDDDSAGAVVGGVIAGLLIVCITIVVLVVVVMFMRRREKRYNMLHYFYRHILQVDFTSQIMFLRLEPKNQI